MMHRYVIAIATHVGDPRFTSMVEAISRRLRDWTQPLNASNAKAWVFNTPPSRLGARGFGRAGCLIGLDFDSEVSDISAVLNSTWGAYVAVSVDEAAGGVTIVRDPTGRIEAWRLSLPGGDLIFSHYNDVYWLQPQQAELNWAYIGHHLNQDFLHGEDTGLIGVTELLPGAQLDYKLGKPTMKLRWWPHELAAKKHDTIDEAMRAIRGAAEGVANAWASQYERISLDLSGGLDSSIVLGLLKGHAHHPELLGITWVMPGGEGDEREYAWAAAQRYGIELVERRPQSDDLTFAKPFSRRLMRPRARVLPLGYDEVGREIAEERRTDAFFTGTGGDHLFFDHLPITAACDHLHHDGLGKGTLRVAVDLAQLSRNTVWSVGAAVIRRTMRQSPTVEKLMGFDNLFLSYEGRSATDYARYLHPAAVAAAASAPPAKLVQILNILELQRHYYRFGRADAAQETHILFSQPLMEACLRVPAHWFGIGGIQRGLAREIFADLLPDVIRRRRSKGGNTTYWSQFLSKRLSVIRELLLEGRLAERGLIDRPVVEAALTDLGLATGKETVSLNSCLSAELWIRQTESDRASGKAENTQTMSA